MSPSNMKNARGKDKTRRHRRHYTEEEKQSRARKRQRLATAHAINKDEQRAGRDRLFAPATKKSRDMSVSECSASECDDITEPFFDAAESIPEEIACEVPYPNQTPQVEESPNTAAAAAAVGVELQATTVLVEEQHETLVFPTWHNVIVPEDIVADFDENNEGGDIDDEEDEDGGGENPSGETKRKYTWPRGVMQDYIKAVHARLHSETKGDASKHALTRCWLLDYLKKNDYWIRRRDAKYICVKLKETDASFKFDDPDYYRNVRVWLPDDQYGMEAMPPCPKCKSASRVCYDSYRNNHFARRIIGLKTNYYIMSRRYKCRTCNSRHMGWNMTSLAHMPHGFGTKFPAFLSWRSGLDKTVLDLMRPLVDAGVRPETYSNILLELHSKEYTRIYIHREQEITRMKRVDCTVAQKRGLFSSFADKSKYNGFVPTGNYLATVYKLYHATIQEHLEREAKKRGADHLSVDASYKEAGHLAQYHGNPMFKGLVTYHNQHSEIRLSHHVVTDSQDQKRGPLRAMINTMNEYGQQLPTLVKTDNPTGDRDFYMAEMPSLRASQAELDQKTTQIEDQTTPLCAVEEGQIREPAYSVAEINMCVVAIRNLFEAFDPSERVISLDTEWDTVQNSRGMVIQSKKLATMQLAYKDPETTLIRSVILHTYKHKKLPDQLVALFNDPTITFVGVGLGGDLAKIGRDYDCVEQMKVVKNVINLGLYARRRDVVQNGSVSLAFLVNSTLHELMEKPVNIRLSKWSSCPLNELQIKYAALDSIKSLQVYFELRNLQDLSIRLLEKDASSGLKVDVVPSRGNAADMATRGGWGEISGANVVECPAACTKSRVRVNSDSRVVLVTKVISNSLVVPGLKKQNGGKISLGDFGPVPFAVPLPLTMLRLHDAAGASRNFPDKLSSDTSTSRQVNTRPNLTGNTPPNPRSETRNADTTDHNIDSHDNDLECIDIENIQAEDEFVLSSSDIELLRALDSAMGNSTESNTILKCKHLDDPPDSNHIRNVFSVIMGDTFHAMDRPKVAVRSEFKKSYKVALREAWYIWNPDKLLHLIQAMKKDQYTDEEIEAMKYHNSKVFTDCVDRMVPPPNVHYWRVRAVFVLFGGMVDSKTKKTFFNERAWKKANGVLKEILKGYYADPPGVSFYSVCLNSCGNPATNKYNMELLECTRGTNVTESYHRTLVQTFGTWCTGIEMSTCILAEHNHRYTHRMSEKRRLGFPKLGHFDTWLIDELQLLVEDNHAVLLYPDWSNTSDYKNTNESFGTVALHSQDLADAIDEIDLPVNIKFTADQQYVCKAMETKCPLLPFHGRDELKLFNRFILEKQFDDEKWAIEWCAHVNGTTIHAKLPVHMRNQNDKHERNQRIKDAVRRAGPGLKRLEALNNALQPKECITAARVDTNSSASTTHPHQSQPTNDNVAMDSVTPIEIPDSMTTQQNTTNQRVYWAPILQPRPLQQPTDQAMRNPSDILMVGGTCLRNNFETEIAVVRKRGQRGKDQEGKVRSKRRCGRCKLHGGEFAQLCIGRGNKGRVHCAYFNEDGTEKRMQHGPCSI
jgi:hypothetical protein